MAFDWSAVAQAGTSLIGSIINHFDQEKLTDLQNNASAQNIALSKDQLNFNKSMADKNYAMQQMQFNYQKQLNDLQMAREDNAMQRKVADLQKAGLSPLMATDGSQAGNLLSASAPQYDLSGINNAYGNVQSARQDYAQRQLQTAQFKLQSKLQIAQLSADLMGAMQQFQKNKLDYEYQKGLNEYVSRHGYRNLNWQSELINVVDKLLGKVNLSSVGDKVKDTITAGSTEFSNMINDFTDLINFPKQDKGGTLNYASLAARRKDVKILNENRNKDENSALSDLKKNNIPSDSTVNYLYRFTDAWRDFEKIDDFRKWLSDPKNKADIISQKKYPFKKSRSLLEN